MSIDGDLMALSDAILVIADDLILAYLATIAPWTVMPGISWLIKIIVNFFVNILVTKTEFLVYVMAITDKVNQEAQDFKTAVQNNQEMLTHGNDQQKAQAKKDLIAAASAFIKLTAP